ncbi:hypothetical protein SAMN02910292_02866 [Lachnospiraceae bacterium XBB2008]|nr:hypothetical protein SAMN02910292_02866 [Lachnospiraceae bacterium XBB2008]
MKRLGSRVIGVLTLLVMIMGLYGCGISKTPIDYGDAEAFEAALNAGENLEGKVVRFTALEFHPDSASGYNVWAGEHLNFISSRNPDIKAGDTVVVRADTIESIMGSWFITYEKVPNAEMTDATITAGSAGSSGVNGADPADDSSAGDASGDSGSNASGKTTNTAVFVTESDATSDTVSDSGSNSGTTSFSVDSSTSEELPLEVTDYGWYIGEPSSFDDNVYVDYCVMIHNPNKDLVAQFPTAIITVRGGDGSILATEEHVGSIVMPEDTVTLISMFSILAKDLTEDAQITFDVECDDFSTGASYYDGVRCSEFEFANVSERNSSSENHITGEITNNSSIDVDMVNVSIVLRKDSEIVFMENTFVDGLKAGKTKAFDFQRYDDWPEHDTIECSAMPW